MTLKQYWKDSRLFTVGFLVVSPLLLLYELGILIADPGVRNGADASFRRIFALFGPYGEWIWLGLLCLGILACVIWVRREKIPAQYYGLPILFEGFLYALFFGPLVLLLRDSLGPEGIRFREYFAGAGPEGNSAALNLLLAVGAGVYEEALFRLVLLSLLYYLGKKLCEFIAVPIWLAALGAILFSSLAFSAFHHVGDFAAPFSWGAFAFRALAGGLLGLIFITRGFGVAVYTHAFYDILYLFTAANT